jgi:hypothetical protein
MGLKGVVAYLSLPIAVLLLLGGNTAWYYQVLGKQVFLARSTDTHAE